jgi:hypothetical protein
MGVKVYDDAGAPGGIKIGRLNPQRRGGEIRPTIKGNNAILLLNRGQPAAHSGSNATCTERVAEMSLRLGLCGLSRARGQPGAAMPSDGPGPGANRL